MSSSTVSKSKASQNVVVAASAASSQYRSSAQYQSSSQYRPSRIDESQTIHQSSNTQSSSQTTSSFGPVRSSIVQGHSHTSTPSYNQQRTAPYCTNSPRTNRRQGGMSHHQINNEYDQVEDECIHPSRLVTVDQKVLDVLIERTNVLENELRTLQLKTDQILKIARKSIKEQELFPTSRSLSKLTPVFWNDKNLLDKPRTPSPTTYLCYLIREMYTKDEIKSKVPQLEPEDGDERLEKVKECLVQLYFSHDPSLFKIFMESKGHESLYWQERSQRSRDNSRARAAIQNNNSNQNMAPNGININNSQDDVDADPDIQTFDDI